jgi:HlyD family secretion protein
MTAYVNVIVAQHRNVLQIPNAALRFKPAEGTPVVTKARSTEDKQGNGGIVYVLQQKLLSAVPVRLGISDGRSTELLAGAIRDGDALVVGTAEPATEQSQGTLRMRPF